MFQTFGRGDHVRPGPSILQRIAEAELIERENPFDVRTGQAVGTPGGVRPIAGAGIAHDCLEIECELLAAPLAVSQNLGFGCMQVRQIEFDRL